MGIVTPSNLAFLRRLNVKSMTDTADIITKTAVNGPGGTRYTDTTQSGVACRRAGTRTGSAEALIGAALTSELVWVFTFPALTLITDNAQIVHNGEKFEVIAVVGPTTNETARRVLAIKKA